VRKQDSGGTSKFVWDGEKVLLETDDGDVTQAIYTLSPYQYGDLVSQRRAAATSYFLFDPLGSTDRLTTGGGAVTDSYAYSGFGSVIVRAGSTDNVYSFGGRLLYKTDSSLELYLTVWRWYDPLAARWLSVDPLGISLSEANVYRYVANQPLVRSDPLGLFQTQIGLDPKDYFKWPIDDPKQAAAEEGFPGSPLEGTSFGPKRSRPSSKSPTGPGFDPPGPGYDPPAPDTQVTFPSDDPNDLITQLRRLFEGVEKEGGATWFRIPLLPGHPFPTHDLESGPGINPDDPGVHWWFKLNRRKKPRYRKEPLR
jgi:RHS repeat-associated protein